jgi:RNA polymerase sigma-70 factor, ECF subfamily
VAALQHLPARQRAALVLCDVLEWPAADAAAMLGTTTAGVTSALQRARAHLKELNLEAEDLAEPAELRELLDRYAAAMAAADPAALARLLSEDVTLEMPPQPEWFTGRDAVLEFLGARVLRPPARWRCVPTRANGQPAFHVYDGDELHGLHVLTVRGGRVARITAFNNWVAPAFTRSAGPGPRR